MKYLDNKYIRIGICVTIILLGIIAVVIQNATKDSGTKINRKKVIASSTVTSNDSNQNNTSLDKKNDENSQKKDSVTDSSEKNSSCNMKEKEQCGTIDRDTEVSNNSANSTDNVANDVVDNKNSTNTNTNTNSITNSTNNNTNNNNNTNQQTSNQNNATKITLTGYIIDEDCFISYKDPSTDTKDCLTMSECAASGYGIAVKENGKYVFYYFDGQISTVSSGERVQNATGGQQLAWQYIDENIISKNQQVTVTGTLTGGNITNPSKDAADGIYYPEIKVESIE